MGVRDTRRTRVVLFVLLVVALGLIAFGYSDGSSPVLRGVRHVSGSVFGGIEHAASSVAGFFGGSGSSGAQVRQLQQEVATLRAELSGARLTKADYEQLHKLLQVAGAGQYRIVAATVIAVAQGYQLTVTLDAGSADGVKTGDTVMNDQGLVGQVTAVTSSTSTVLLASDGSAVIGVEVAPSGELGTITGPGPLDGGDGPMRLNMLNSSSVIRVGEQLVTAPSTSSQDYVPGVPVGTITKVVIRNGSLTAAAEVKPFVDYTALGVVGIIIQPPAQNPRFSVLPPIPRPLPAVTVTVTPRATKPGTSPSPTPTTGG
jgi:rod shape-determining protein MreC